MKSGSRDDAKPQESGLQLHTRHTNFIHIDTKVDFSRNVLLCQRARVSGTWQEGRGGA